MRILICLLYVMVVQASYVMMTSYLPNNTVSRNRFARFAAQIEAFGLPHEYLHGETIPGQRLEGINRGYIAMLNRLRQLNYTYGIICEEDTQFHANFTQELDPTIEAAGNFTILHLCATPFLYGRPSDAQWSRNEKYPLLDKTTDPTGRIFANYPRWKNTRPHNTDYVWPGSPVCFVVRNIPDILDLIIDMILHESEHMRQLGFKAPIAIDLVMRDIAIAYPGSKCVYAPRLCWENEQDGKVKHPK